MIELMLLLAALMTMARRGRSRRRKFRRYLRGAVELEFELATLASRTLVSAIFPDSVNETTWVSSLIASWSFTDFTAGLDIGPTLVGVAHSDYADSEIEAWVEQSESWEVDDLVAREIGSRKIKRVGQFSTNDVLNDGKPIRTKLNWYLNTGQTLRVWAYNKGLNPYATTSPVVGVSGHVNLWPR